MTTDETTAEYIARKQHEAGVARAKFEAEQDAFRAEVEEEFHKTRGSGESVQRRKQIAHDTVMMRRAMEGR